MEEYQNEILFLVGLTILALPILVGPLRHGLKHVLISIGLIIVYVGWYTKALGFLGVIPDGITFTFMGVILCIMAVTSICYFIEKYRENEGPDSETFYDERLFFRYGENVKTDLIPIGVEKRTEEEEQDLLDRLFIAIMDNAKAKFGSDPAFSSKYVLVADLNNKKDARYFVKLVFKTSRNSTFFHFINVKKISEQIVVNSLEFIRSRHQWYHVLVFIVSSPTHYWSWIYHWITKNYSIRSYLGKFYYGNSFDIIDLESYVKSSTFSVLGGIEKFAKENDLLTEELRQIIINNINNTQNIKINKSKGLKIGKIKISS